MKTWVHVHVQLTVGINRFLHWYKSKDPGSSERVSTAEEDEVGGVIRSAELAKTFKGVCALVFPDSNVDRSCRYIWACGWRG